MPGRSSSPPNQYFPTITSMLATAEKLKPLPRNGGKHHKNMAPSVSRAKAGSEKRKHHKNMAPNDSRHVLPPAQKSRNARGPFALVSFAIDVVQEIRHRMSKGSKGLCSLEVQPFRCKLAFLLRGSCTASRGPPFWSSCATFSGMLKLFCQQGEEAPEQ